jgi:hypothetical protein
MSIATDRFGSIGTWDSGRNLLRHHLPATTVVTERECHYCGFVPADESGALRRCPKCGGSAWQRRVTRHAAPEPEQRSTVVRDIGRALSKRGTVHWS